MRAWKWFLWVLIGVGLLAIGSQVDWKRLSVNDLRLTLNDQVGYVSTARRWLDEGRLDSSIIYPSLLRQSFRRNSLYMPGFYAELMLVYRWLGYSPVTSRIPALLSFLLACGLVCGITRRLYGPKVAVYATALFAFFPLNLIYAFTAMAEIPLLATGLAAFAVFVWATESIRWWLGPLALALPMLFRETGIVLGLVMAAMLCFGPGPRRTGRALSCGALACAVLLALLLSPAGAGRPSMWKANILGQGGFGAVYTDAFALDELPASPLDWAGAVGQKFLLNLHSLRSLRVFADSSLEATALWFVLSGFPLGLWLWRRERDAFALGVAVAVSVLLAADLCVYSVWIYRGVRIVLLMQPLVAVLWGILIETEARERADRLRPVLVVGCALLGVSTAIYALRKDKAAHPRTLRDTALVESIVGNDRRLLASPSGISLDYVNEHYPQLWAFVPYDCPTTQLLEARYGIGTLIIPAQSAVAEQRRCGTRLQYAGERTWNGTHYWIYRGNTSPARP